jgi:hydrogenase maturation protein HypF
MAAFQMCPQCEAEYHDPTNRRFHAQPNACPICGPQLSMDESETPAILAVKGIGGFHLVCDATSDSALQLLRDRKNRFEQPFAVMVRDIEAAREIAEVDDDEAHLLLSRERPIVLLRKRSPSPLSPLVAPGNGYVGVMLPYAPLHYLLLRDKPLVMTSANPSGQPIVRDNDEAATVWPASPMRS